MNLTLFAWTTAILIAVAAISSFEVYASWDDIRDGGLFLLVNTVLVTVNGGLSLLALVKELLGCLKKAVDCVLKITCILPLLEFLYWISLTAYGILTGYIAYGGFKGTFKFPSNKGLMAGYVSQLTGLGLIGLIHLAYLINYLCGGCCCRKKGKSKNEDEQPLRTESVHF